MNPHESGDNQEHGVNPHESGDNQKHEKIPMKESCKSKPRSGDNQKPGGDENFKALN